MGAYLSEPVTEKLSSDESSAVVQCGSSCMQGWRINQEDAHNTILDYDKNTTLFAVYDGHGGAEVAAYCAQHLPGHIKDTEAYKSGDVVKALEEAFLSFDAKIVTKEVMDELKEIAGEMNPPPPDEADMSSGHSSDEDENMSSLYKEAQLPLKDVLAQYDQGGVLRAKLAEGGTPMSPFLRAKKSKGEPSGSGSSGDGAASSSKGASSSSAGAASSAHDTCGAATEEISADKRDDEDVSSTSKGTGGDLNGEVSTSNSKLAGDAQLAKEVVSVPDSSEDTKEEPSESAAAAAAGPARECNGDVTEGKPVAGENSISSSQNGDAAKPSKGKTIDKAISALVSSSAPPLSPAALRRKKMVPRRAAADMFKSLLLSKVREAEAEEDSSDSNDETFEGAESHSSDEEQVNGASDSSNEEGEEEEGEEEESSDDDEECGHDMNMTEEPGSDSGCTAVVAVLRGNELFVANAGDSRCIVCREGRAVDMSVDHKPEDEPELARITRAGGSVSTDGRINGGLNLSRAIGDHSYKQNKELGPREQMITALPDVRTHTVDPDKDEFMVLACDGIWNFMSSQDVCDFISPRLKEGRERLSQICEEMFDHCLAPNTMGDGTGCDNMTAILVTFKKNAAGAAEVASVSTTECPKKRTAEGDATADGSDAKRQKVEDSLSSSVVTSSV